MIRFIGRTAELEKCRAALTGSRGFIAVEGEPGVGKSRLVREILAGRTDVLWGRALAIANPFPLGPVLTAFRSSRSLAKSARHLRHRTALRRLFPELGDQGQAEDSSALDSRVFQHEALSTLVELLRELAPVAMVIEDLHLADQLTADFVALASDALPDGAHVVVTYRPQLPELTRDVIRTAAAALGSTFIGLKGMSMADVQSLIREVLGSGPVSKEFVELVHQNTGGVPLAVEEALRTMVERGDLVEREGAWSRLPIDLIWVPTTIREGVLDQLDRLSSDARTLAEVLALTTVPISEAQLLQAAGFSGDRTEAALREVLRSGLVRRVAGGLYEGPHALAQQAIAESLPFSVSARLHGAIADVYRSEADQAMRVHHLRLAGRLDEWAREAIEVAARYVLAADDRAAALLLRDVVSDPGTPAGPYIEALLKFGSYAFSSGMASIAVPIFRSALDRELAPTIDGLVRSTLGALTKESGDASAAWTVINEAIPKLQADARYLAMAHLALARPWFVDGTRTDHLDHLAAARTAAAHLDDGHISRIMPLDEPVVRSYCGDEDALTEVEGMAAPLDWLGLRAAAQAQSNLTHAALAAGDNVRAEKFLEQARDLLDDRRHDRGVRHIYAAGLLVDLACGRWATLRADAQGFIDLYREGQGAEDARGALSILGLARDGDDAAVQFAEVTLQMQWRAGALPIAVRTATSLARTLMDRGQLPRASHVLDTAFDILRRKDMLHWSGALCVGLTHLFLDQDARHEAKRVVSEVRAGIDGRWAPGVAAHLLLAEAELAFAGDRIGEAEGLAARAREAFAALHAPHELATATERLGWFALSRDLASASRSFRSTVRLFDGLEATADLLALKRRLRTRGVALPGAWRRGSRALHELSSREVEIADLVAEGMTNKEIAERLVLSVRTVEGHVERIRGKLGLSSRRELARGASDTRRTGSSYASTP